MKNMRYARAVEQRPERELYRFLVNRMARHVSIYGKCLAVCLPTNEGAEGALEKSQNQEWPSDEVSESRIFSKNFGSHSPVSS